jgi:hypothetical protein
VSTAINTDADDTKKNDNAKDNDDEIREGAGAIARARFIHFEKSFLINQLYYFRVQGLDI